LSWVSPHSASQIRLPQLQAVSQSVAHDQAVSPHEGSQAPLPHRQDGVQMWSTGLQMVVGSPPGWQLAHASPSIPQATFAVPGRHSPSSEQHPSPQVAGPQGPMDPPVPPKPASMLGGSGSSSPERPHPAKARKHAKDATAAICRARKRRGEWFMVGSRIRGAL